MCSPLSGQMHRRVSWKNVLLCEGIPYDVVGGTNFYARREIKDLLAYLKTVDNGRDDLAVKRIINVPEAWNRCSDHC